MKTTVPIRTISENNASQREHWAKKHKRHANQRHAAMVFVQAAQPPRADRYVVTLTRLSRDRRGILDDDNLRGALKHVRDGVAEVLGVDDGDDRVTWQYAQRVAGDYAVEIEIEAA